jgi:hypothetical protein
MNERRIWLAVAAMVAVMAAPATAEDFWSSLKKDFKGLTGAIKGGIEDITEGKKDVEEVIDDARQLKEEFTGAPENQPRYDAAWVAELQQRLTAEGFDPGPIDGAFGDRTSRAITAFQRQAGISPDGLPRPTVMRALRARTQGVQIAGPQPQPGGHAPASSDPLAWPGLTTDPTGQAMVGAPWSGQIATGVLPPGQAASQNATYARFLEAHLALHPDVAGDDAFALQYLSYLPAGEDCPVEFELLEGSEFDRQRFFTQIWPAWKARFAETVSRARPPGGEVFRVDLERTAGEYDFATGSFGVELAQPGNAEFTVGQSRFASHSRSGMRFCTSPSGPGRFPVGFAIDLTNADAIDRLPLSAIEAEAFDQRNSERRLQFVVDFVLEQTAPAGHVGGAGQGTGRIVGAAVVDPVSKQMLHRYDPAIFAPPSDDPWDAFPAPDYRRLLLSLVARSRCPRSRAAKPKWSASSRSRPATRCARPRATRSGDSS